MVSATALSVAVGLLGAMLLVQSFPDFHGITIIHATSHLNPRESQLVLNNANTAIITAITGGIDQERLQQNAGIFVYDETARRLPFPRHDVNQRLRSKYFKMSTHWLHPEFSSYIWVDGSFTIDSDGLRSWLIAQLGTADCAFFKHPERQSILEEFDAVMHAITKGDEYIRIRYGNESMKAQVDSYIDEGFPVGNFPLLYGGLFIRRNLPYVNAAFDHWLIENLKWTIQDQLSLPYILWKHNLTFKVINGSSSTGPYYSNQGHVTLS